MTTVLIVAGVLSLLAVESVRISRRRRRRAFERAAEAAWQARSAGMDAGINRMSGDGREHNR